jgi:hypothetical protein
MKSSRQGVQAKRCEVGEGDVEVEAMRRAGMDRRSAVTVLVG